MIRVDRSETEAGPGDIDELLRSLDSQPGAWLGCDVEAEGLYKRESTGCVSPALAFSLDGNEFRVLALSATGHALLRHVLPLAAFSGVEGGLALRFAPCDAAPHPVIGILRAFLALFSAAYPELALFGALSFDYYRLAGSAPLPDDKRRRMMLFFPDRVLVTREGRSRWVHFRFPGLASDAAPPTAVFEPVQLESAEDDQPPGGHAEQVRRGLERLARGEVFSLVLSQTFRRRADVKSSEAFSALRALNAYPAMFFLNLGGGETLFGASPDLQVRADADFIESAPVCGTLRRGSDPIEDADQALALLNSGKEDASLAACADSDRNDKVTVCEPGSVELVSSRRVHFFSTIIHSIAHTRGRRRSGADVFDILLAHSTPATVTGMPKPAAIAAIEEIESTWRGWYAGAVVRMATDASMEVMTILRAARVVGGLAEVRTGGNLLADSDPEKEEDETRLKAQTLFRVLSGSSPRAPARKPAYDRRFKIALAGPGDPMLPLLADCLESVGCEIGASGDTKQAGMIRIHTDAPMASVRDDAGALIAIGAGALALLEEQGGRLTTLSEPQYARRIQAHALDSGFMAGSGAFELGIYARQVIDQNYLSPGWRATVVSSEGWVIVAEAENRWHIAILCRPDSVQSMKGDAGRRLLRAALERLASLSAVALSYNNPL